MRASQQELIRFIGIDLGGGRGKKTALAMIEVGETGPVVMALHPRTGELPLYDAALLKMIRAFGPGSVVCVDAPLTLPPCVRCQRSSCPGQEICDDAEVASMRWLALATPNAATPSGGEPTSFAGRGPSREGTEGLPGALSRRRGRPSFTPYTQRATEIYLSVRRGIPSREALGQGMGPLTARACHLVRALTPDFQLNQNLIEVHPRSTMDVLGFCEPYKKRVDSRIDILAQISDLTFGPGVWRERCRQSDHAFDAVMSAYIGYLRSRDAWALPSELAGLTPEIGYIWMPPASEEAPSVDDAAGVQGT